MPRPSCEPCCNPGELSRHLPMYRDAHLQILCSILASVENIAPSVPQVPNIDSSYEANVTDAGPTVFTFTGDIKGFSVSDLGGSVIRVTVVLTNTGGGNQLFYVPSNGTVNFELTTATADLVVSVELQRITPSTSGPAIINGMHPGL